MAAVTLDIIRHKQESFLRVQFPDDEKLMQLLKKMEHCYVTLAGKRNRFTVYPGITRTQKQPHNRYLHPCKPTQAATNPQPVRRPMNQPKKETKLDQYNSIRCIGAKRQALGSEHSLATKKTRLISKLAVSLGRQNNNEIKDRKYG